MGTNYYAVRGRCPECGRYDESDRLHIGKSSIGWPFLFHAVPEKGLVDWASWRRYLAEPGVEILDEYNGKSSVEGLDALIVVKRRHSQDAHVLALNRRTSDGDQVREGEFF